MEEDLTIKEFKFWDLWLQKILRNIASVKFQWLLLLYIPIIYGMFTISPVTCLPWISPIEGLSFLGGGFVTLALGRIYAKTKLREIENGHSIHKERMDDESTDQKV